MNKFVEKNLERFKEELKNYKLDDHGKEIDMKTLLFLKEATGLEITLEQLNMIHVSSFYALEWAFNGDSEDEDLLHG